MEHQLYEVIESNSALREFARVYSINGGTRCTKFFRRCEPKYNERFTE